MNRNKPKIALKPYHLLVGVILFFYFSFAFADTSSISPPIPVAKVVWVKGNFSATASNQEQRMLQKDSLIYLKDTLTTDNTSQAQIVFTDNTLMTFRAKTKFFVEEYQFHAKDQEGSIGKYVMKLMEGGFRTITGLIAKNKSSDYKVNTPVATIGVRGTDYTVYIHNGKLDLGFLSGSPCVSNAGSSMCLSEKLRYVQVPSPKSAPIAMENMPTTLKETLNIIPVQITSIPPSVPPPASPDSTRDSTSPTQPPSPVEGATPSSTPPDFTTSSSPQSDVSDVKAQSTSTATPPTKSGTVSNFCIQ